MSDDERFERDLRDVILRDVPAAAPGELRASLHRIPDSRPIYSPRSLWRISGPHVAVGLAAVLLVALIGGLLLSARPAVGPTASQSPTASPNQVATTPTVGPTPALIYDHLSGSGYGLSFYYPADWHFVPFFFFLAGFTNGDSTALVPNCCHLNPNQLAVSISIRSATPIDIGAFKSPESDVKSVGDWLVVKQNMPAAPSDLFDVHTYWMIGRPGPGETIYSVSAIFRGPDLAPMQAQVEAFVDSITLDPEPAASPS
jgi:hypothetical protein